MKDDSDRLVDGTLTKDPFGDTIQIPGPGAPVEPELTALDETLLALKHRKIEKSPSLIGNGLLKRGRIAILYGVGGGSKTWIVLRLALAVARGTEWCGFPTTKGRVGIVSFEMFDEDIQDRLSSISPGDDSGLEDIFVLSRDKLPVLKLPDAGERILRWAKERKLDLVIIDPLADTLTGPETNETISPILDELKRISLESGAAPFLNHHTRKRDTSGKADDPLDAMRGPSQLRDRVDLLLYVEKKPGDTRKLTCTKARGAKEPEPVWLDATGALTDAPEAAATRAEENVASVRQHLQEHPEKAFTASELVSALDLRTAGGTTLKEATVRRRYLPELVAEGVAIEVPGKGPMDRKSWKWGPGTHGNEGPLPRQPRQGCLGVLSQQNVVEEQ